MLFYQRYFRSCILSDGKTKVTAVSVISNSALQFVQRKSRVLWFTFQKRSSNRKNERRFRNDDTFLIHKCVCTMITKVIFFKYLFYRLNLVYLTFILHGIGTLMPWNMFITAKDVSFHRNVCFMIRFYYYFFFALSTLSSTSWVRHTLDRKI